MTLKLGIIMDPIETIKPQKDTTLAILLEAQRRNWILHYFQQDAIYYEKNKILANSHCLTVHDNVDHWFDLMPQKSQILSELDVILMRKDPPVDMTYLYTTHLLQHLEQAGVFVVNSPQSLRDVNEKLYTLWFPQCCPPTLVAADKKSIKKFIQQEHDVILKPLDGMGGTAVFRVQIGDVNLNVIIETLTHQGSRLLMAQRYIPEIKQGDKRILLINGEPFPYALARHAPPGETRANLAVGGTGTGIELSERDRWICAQVGPHLREKGLLFVGLDVIGDYLTEINVTSPTCVRELDKLYKTNISALLCDVIEEKVFTFGSF